MFLLRFYVLLLHCIYLVRLLSNQRVLLLVYLDGFQCTDGFVNCENWSGSSPSRVCVAETSICDGLDDCGNGWDEEFPTCDGQFAN